MAMILNRRKSSRCMWSLVITTFVLCFVFAFISFSFENKYGLTARNSVGSSAEKLTEGECISVCDSKECLHHTRIILDNVQETVEPCENFYKFACGRILERSDPDKDNTFVSRYLIRMRNNLKNLLENLEANSKGASGKMKTVYDSCVKYGSSENQAVPTILQFLNDFGIQNWPYLAPDYKFVESGISSVVANLLHYQEYGFVFFSYVGRYGCSETEDPDSKTNLTLKIAESSYEKKELSVRKYEVDRILKYFNLDTETINGIWDDSEAINDAIKNLKEQNEKIYYEDENATAVCIDCMMDPGGEWKYLCESLGSFIDISGIGEDFNKNHANILGQEIYFMENIFHVLSNFSDRAIANYLVLNMFLNHLNDLNFYFRLTYNKYTDDHKVLSLTDQPISRWQYCVQWIATHMTFALAHEFVKKDFTITMLQEVHNLTKELLQETAERVSEQKWISNFTSATISEKILATDDYSAMYPRLFSNQTYISRMFEEFHPSEGSFLRNVFEYRRFIAVEGIRDHLTIQKVQWLKFLFLPGASGGDGVLSIEFGILLPPTYSPRLKKLINVVTLGTIIVHEIGHSMQSFFTEFYPDQSAKDYYDEKIQCLVKQYSQFRIESIGKNLNASRYVREDEPDNIAVSIIDKLIPKYLANGGDISLPALPYSTEQMLYISIAQNWCSAFTKQFDELVYNSGSHTPPNFRLLGMMQNSERFSKAFSCPEGSYMNPSIKCSILTGSD